MIPQDACAQRAARQTIGQDGCLRLIACLRFDSKLQSGGEQLVFWDAANPPPGLTGLRLAMIWPRSNRIALGSAWDLFGRCCEALFANLRHLTITVVQRRLALMGFTEFGDVGGVAGDEIHVGSSAVKSQDQTSGVAWV